MATTGTDAPGFGTSANPYRTIRYSVQQALPGAVITVRAGVYAETAETFIAQPVTIQGNGEAIIDAYNRDTVTSFKYMMGVVNASNVVIDGIQFRNCIGNGVKAIYVLGTGNNVTIQNCSFSNIGWTNNSLTRLPPNNGTVANAIRVESNTAAAYVNINILNNDVSNCATGWGEAITLTGNVNGFLVEGNAVHHIANIGIVAAGNYSTAPASVNHARNGIIRGNEVYHCMSGIATSAGIYLDGAMNCVVEQNSSHHNGAGISVGAEVALPFGAPEVFGHRIRNNLVYENSVAGIFIGSGTPGNRVIFCSFNNNTCFHNATAEAINGITTINGTPVATVVNGSAGEVLLFSNISTMLQNNIIYPLSTRRAIVAMAGNATMELNADYNVYFHDDATPLFFSANQLNNIIGSQTWNTIPDFTTATGLEANGVFGTPGFAHAALYNFIPATGALLIDKGDPVYNTSFSGTTDLAGNTRIYNGIRTDAGAYEYQGGTYPAVTYTFTGNGFWNIPGNWQGNQIPPLVLPPGSQIIINPIASGECILNRTQTIMPGASLTVIAGKKMRVLGRLVE